MWVYAAADGDVLVHGLAPPGGHRCHLSLHGAHVQTSHLQSSLRALPRGQYSSVPTLSSMYASDLEVNSSSIDVSQLWEIAALALEHARSDRLYEHVTSEQSSIMCMCPGEHVDAHW